MTVISSPMHFVKYEMDKTESIMNRNPVKQSHKEANNIGGLSLHEFWFKQFKEYCSPVNAYFLSIVRIVM